MSAWLRNATAFLAFHWQHLGFLGRLGLALCVGAACYGLVVMPGNDAEADSLRAEIAHVRADQRVLEQKLATTGGTGDATQSAIVIPMTADAPALLLALEDIARRHGLQFSRREYRYADPAASLQAKSKLRPVGPSRFVEVRVNAPTHGSYGSVRVFLDEIRRELPTLALDDISLKRGSIGEGEVQAVLRFSLFMRNAK